MNSALPPGSISIVIASPRDPALAAACVASVAPQARALAAPVLLARAGDADRVGPHLRANSSGSDWPVTLVDASAGASLPVLRGAGLSAVRTPYAALIEDHCLAAPGWLEALAARAGDADFVGGRMGNAQRDRAIDWAAYFAEYGFFTGVAAGSMPPLATGANVLYGPRALPLAARWASEGFWEDVIHARLLAAGCRLAVTPAAEMRQNLRYAIGAFCVDRHRHGFAYARVRLREQPSLSRWLRALSTPALPFVLARRLAANVRSDERGEFLRALPLTVLFLSAWSTGEWSGYVRGGLRQGLAR